MLKRRSPVLRWSIALGIVLAMPACRSVSADPPAETTEKTVDQDLRLELLEMREVDQQARRGVMQIRPGTPASENDALEKLLAIDRRHTARMKAIVQTHGWPGTSLVSRDGAAAAWLLVQHADLDVAFQAHCLALLEEAVKRGEAQKRHWAYLVDRVRVNQKQPQLYGTQFRHDPDGSHNPHPIEDAAHVDERRKSVGLSPLAEYAKRLRKLGAIKSK